MAVVYCLLFALGPTLLVAAGLHTYLNDTKEHPHG